jgi:hypothetical protein
MRRKTPAQPLDAREQKKNNVPAYQRMAMDKVEHDEFDQSLAIDDDGAIQTLTPFHDARPMRQAWRADPDAAPLGKPVYAREPDSIRVLIALRDEEGWVAISRTGELRSIEAVASWAPLAAGIG